MGEVQASRFDGLLGRGSLPAATFADEVVDLLFHGI